MGASNILLREACSVTAWTPDAAYDRAIQIGERLSSLAIRNDGSANWRGIRAGEAGTPPTIGTLDSDFYDGAAGIGLFLLALARKTGRADFHEIGRHAFVPLRRRLDAGGAFDQPERILGGAEGLTSCLYPLVVSAALADCPALLSCAEQLAAQLTPALIETDRQFDIIAGTAGTILGLLALHEAGRPIGLEKALACGQHLLAHARSPKGAPQSVQLTGISRGAAGIALAFARLGHASGQAEFLDAASSWVAYEDALFDKAHGNWPDRRSALNAQSEADFAVCGWCHGATGIGFARLGMGRLTGLDVTRAVRRTITEPLADADSICCGNFGRISLLLEAGIRLERPELIAQARTRAAQRLADRAYEFPRVHGDHAQNLGFFQGVSGIGYELLRLLDPQLFPCALLWDVAVSARAVGAKTCA
jgi:lantibiotic modifying enzyme